MILYTINMQVIYNLDIKKKLGCPVKKTRSDFFFTKTRSYEINDNMNFSVIIVQIYLPD